MTSRIHEFDAREGGAFRVSLTYDDPARAGKTSAHTDTYRGRFVQRARRSTGSRRWWKSGRARRSP